MLFSALILSSFLTSSVSHAAPTSADSKAEEVRVQAAVAKEKKILNQYSLEELNSAGTYLMAIFEASLDPKTQKKTNEAPPALPNATPKSVAGSTANSSLSATTNAPSNKILECDPSPEKAQLWLSGPLHALIDEKTEIEEKSISKAIERELKKSDKKWRQCADQCQCASYMAVIEEVQNSARAADQDSMSSGAGSKKQKAKKLSVADENRLKNTGEWLTKENKKVTSVASAQCAARQNWFCKSPLQAYLNDAADE